MNPVADLLHDDILERILVLSANDPRNRVAQLSLVCKQWKRMEQSIPYCPAELKLRPKDISLGFVQWHLRDITRLRQVQLQNTETLGVEERSFLQSEGYCSGVWELLQRLSGAQALCSLEIVPPDLTAVLEPPTCLSLLCNLAALKCLTIRQWACSKADTLAFSQLSKLRNLKRLELIKVYLDTSTFDLEDDIEETEQADILLQEALSMLPLTHLRLSNVELMDGHAQNEDILTNLRSLTYDRPDYISSVDFGSFPRITPMSQLTCLQISCCEHEPALEELAGLHNLEELTIRRCGTLEQILLSAMAGVTKIALYDCVTNRIDTLLPLHTLQRVRNLTIGSYTPLDPPQWPTTWGHLPDLTRLALHYNHKEPQHRKNYFPEFAMDIESLKVLEITIDIGFLVSPQGVESLAQLMSNNATLMKLQIEVVSKSMAALSPIDMAKMVGVCDTLSGNIVGLYGKVQNTFTEGQYQCAPKALLSLVREQI